MHNVHLDEHLLLYAPDHLNYDSRIPLEHKIVPKITWHELCALPMMAASDTNITSAN